ncbi:MAG: twin-arginine translocase subunit TatC [Desulfobacterales bacterium CG07_land_8_20_14_0_80_52_14]|nr:MAG: twin-arginine translocase subunit TatC [Desulfobacterales bacterium CG23_combo_of_CG06-09_8_20_14_all_52_9]PIU49519.1 MAG: twin-arginine translocase subunit TatC [Desulfobacterales bacterium CG07_land_8_20_14_0_80_52_14]
MAKALNEEDKLPFIAHLEELRKRLIICFIAIGVGFALSYGFKEKLFDILTRPLIAVMREGDKLIYTSLPEAFFAYLKVAFLAGVMIAAPVILYEFWMFVAPGLYQKEKRLLLPIVFLSSFFFVGGALFGYFVVFPFGFQYFLSFATDIIRPLPSMKEYLSLATMMLLAFGLVFELPLLLAFMSRLGLVSVAFLKKNRKYALLLIFIVAAILTPPDVISQIMMALPMMALYELGILGARIFERKKPEDDGA